MIVLVCFQTFKSFISICHKSTLVAAKSDGQYSVSIKLKIAGAFTTATPFFSGLPQHRVLLASSWLVVSFLLLLAAFPLWAQIIFRGPRVKSPDLSVVSLYTISPGGRGSPRDTWMTSIAISATPISPLSSMLLPPKCDVATIWLKSNPRLTHYSEMHREKK